MSNATHGITLESAKAIIAGVFAAGADQGLAPLGVVVLDAAGHLKAFERQDGTSPLRFEVAHGKAYGAVGMGVSSRALGNASVDRPHFGQGLNGAFGGAMIPVPGGILVTDPAGGDEIIAAVGVTGDTSDNDEAAGIAGIEAAGLTPVI